MSSFSVSIRTPEIVGSASFFSEFWRYLAAHKSEAETKIKELLVNSARDGHRSGGGNHYQNQTGQLSRSTKAKGSFDIGKAITLYVDRSQVDYAQYIIEEQHFNDPFIDESIEYNLPEINRIIIELYNDAVLAWNNQ